MEKTFPQEDRLVILRHNQLIIYYLVVSNFILKKFEAVKLPTDTTIRGDRLGNS